MVVATKSVCLSKEETNYLVLTGMEIPLVTKNERKTKPLRISLGLGTRHPDILSDVNIIWRLA